MIDIKIDKKPPLQVVVQGREPDTKDAETRRQIIKLVGNMLKRVEKGIQVKPNYCSPSMNFEKASGFKNIAGRYEMPDGKAHADFEKEFHKDNFKYLIPYTNEKYLSFLPREMIEKIDAIKEEGLKKGLPSMLKTFDRLTELNPELKKVKLDRTDTVKAYHAVLGVTSQFNVDDINHFLTRKGYYAKDGKENKLMKKIEEKSKAPIHWVPSWPTLKKMELQLYKTRNAEKSSAVDAVMAKRQNGGR